MSSDQTRRVMGGYFTALDTGEFTRFFTDAITWTIVDGGAVARGRREVQEAILDLHAAMSDTQTRQVVIADEAAFIEGSCAGVHGQEHRVRYCVAYDLDGSRMQAMRAYGALAAFTVTDSA